MAVPPAIALQALAHRYGDHQALDDVSFDVAAGEIFGLLGPNGGGKTTLFRVLATLLPVQRGRATLAGFDVAGDPEAVRRAIGVTFQSPSLDKKLTVAENLKHQAHLYGLSGATMRTRIDDLLAKLSLSDRRSDRVESLSGGMQRRVEIAKGLLHEPRVLLLDEPSAGLDPGARHDLWRYLAQLRAEAEVTVLVTTHLMDEAERCDRLAILDRGRIVALGTPDELRSSVGGDCLTIRGDRPDELARRIAERFQVHSQRVGDALRIERERGHDLLRELVDAFPGEIESIALGKPTLEDVFIARTGHRFWDDAKGESSRQSAVGSRQ
ncbi:MAG: ABC transporter ATP-binding protein [Planctomycetaceae bacterium]